MSVSLVEILVAVGWSTLNTMLSPTLAVAVVALDSTITGGSMLAAALLAALAMSDAALLAALATLEAADWPALAMAEPAALAADEAALEAGRSTAGEGQGSGAQADDGQRADGGDMHVDSLRSCSCASHGGSGCAARLVRS